MDVMLKVSEDDHGEPSPTYLQLSNILDQLASVAPKKAHRAVGVKLAILKNRHRSYPEVEILIQQDQDEAGKDLDNNNDEQLDQACGTSTALKESASVATETSNGDVSKTIAMVPIPEFTPLVECFINHMDNVGYHKAVACPEFMLTMSSLERSDLIKVQEDRTPGASLLPVLCDAAEVHEPTQVVGGRLPAHHINVQEDNQEDTQQMLKMTFTHRRVDVPTKKFVCSHFLC
jgi:hypothetical protein